MANCEVLYTMARTKYTEHCCFYECFMNFLSQNQAAAPGHSFWPFTLCNIPCFFVSLIISKEWYSTYKYIQNERNKIRVETKLS